MTSEPAYVVGSTRCGIPVRAARALPSPVVEPPPTETTESAATSCARASAASVTSTGVCSAAPVEGPRGGVAQHPGHPRRERPLAGGGQDQRASASDPPQLVSHPGQGARAEDGPRRIGVVLEGVQWSVLGFVDRSWRRLARKGSLRAVSGRRPADRARSGDLDLDVDGHPVGDDVVDGRALAGLLDDRAQHLLGRVPLDDEPHADLLVAVADRLEAEDAVEVDVAGHGGADLGERHTSRGRDVGQARGEAGRQGVEHELDRGRAVVLADEDGRVVGVEDELALVRALLADAEEVGDRRSAVRALLPLVVGAELELRGGRHLLDGVEGGEERRGVDAVAVRRCLGGGHGGLPSRWCGAGVPAGPLVRSVVTRRRRRRVRVGRRARRPGRRWRRRAAAAARRSARGRGRWPARR